MILWALIIAPVVFVLTLHVQRRWNLQKRVQRRMDALSLAFFQSIGMRHGEDRPRGAVYRWRTKLELVESREFKLLTFSSLFAALAAFQFLPSTMAGVFLAVAAVLISYRFIYLFLKRRRENKIREELPGVLDLLVICLGSGLGINAAFERVLREMEETPLQEEFRQIVNEAVAGLPFEETLKNFSSRVPIPEVQSLGGAIIQAHKTGVSLADTIKIQSETMRDTMKMRLKERLMRVPILVLFPMVFFILPVLFIVILGPGMIEIFKQIGSL